MSGQYGRSFASKLNEEGSYAEAVEAATRAIDDEPKNPEHFIDRATALVALEREAEALPDFVVALQLDEEAQILETDLVDDAYFSALLAAARADAALSVEAAVLKLRTYLDTLPNGRHVRDVTEWTERLRGQRKSEFVKRRLEDVPDDVPQS